MVQLILMVTLIVLFFICMKKDARSGMEISSLLIIASAIASGMCGGKNHSELESVKEHQIDCINAYQASDREEEDWLWLTEKLDDANKEIDAIESKTYYLLFDIRLLILKPDYQEYKITITDDKIILPENYDAVVSRNVITRNEKG